MFSPYQPPPKSSQQQQMIMILFAFGAMIAFYFYKKSKNRPRIIDIERDTISNVESEEDTGKLINDAVSENDGPCVREDNVKTFRIKHHRSDAQIYPTLIYFNVIDGNEFYSFRSGFYKKFWKYLKIPEFSGDEFYTFDVKDYNGRTDFYEGNFKNYKTGMKPELVTNTFYTVKVYGKCINGQS